MGICHSKNSEKQKNLKSKEKKYIYKDPKRKKHEPSSHKRIFDTVENRKYIIYNLYLFLYRKMKNRSL